MNIAISGFGRIGKTFLKAAIEQDVLGKDFNIVAINTRGAPEFHAHLFKYDSVFGKFNGRIEIKDNLFIVNGHKIKWISETDPLKLPWKECEIDLVLESTGQFKKQEDLEKHIITGAKKVLLSAPAEDCDATIIIGVNDHLINKAHKIFSLGSCTTNCLAPLLKILDQTFGIEKGFMSTVHAYTNDQRLLDGSHNDLRRARAGAINIIPTTTGAAKTIGTVLPTLAGKMDGLAFRVPVPNGSLNDIIVLVKKETNVEEVNEAIKKASENELRGIVGYTEEALVSSDIIGRKESAILDASLTKVIDNLIKISAWYDNEYGYSNRLVDFIKKLAKQ